MRSTFPVVKLNTAISRKVVGKNVHATIPKGNMGYDQYTVPNDCSCRTYFSCFPLALANICPWPLVPFFQFSLENRADKTTHNTFRDCRVHFFRQPFSKQLYTDSPQCMAQSLDFVGYELNLKFENSLYVNR